MFACMALHIRDFRHSDRAGLSRLRERARHIGVPPPQEDGFHTLIGLRDTKLAGAIWLILDGDTGILPAIAADLSAAWQSDVLELIAEACLWLTSRGAAWIELPSFLEDADLLSGLTEMQFRPGPGTGRLKRLVPARSAA
jgi:hypothetical protein